MVVRIECPYEPPHYHEFPDDWKFGGANGLHPGADPRWKPSVYTYYDASTQVCHVTSAPLCDDQALDEFTVVARFSNPKWLSVRRPDGTQEMLPWTYDAEEDLLTKRSSS